MKLNIPKDIQESADKSFGRPISEAGRDSKQCYIGGMLDEREKATIRLIAELTAIADKIGSLSPNSWQIVMDRIDELKKETA